MRGLIRSIPYQCVVLGIALGSHHAEALDNGADGRQDKILAELADLVAEVGPDMPYAAVDKTTAKIDAKINDFSATLAEAVSKAGVSQEKAKEYADELKKLVDSYKEWKKGEASLGEKTTAMAATATQQGTTHKEKEKEEKKHEKEVAKAETDIEKKNKEIAKIVEKAKGAQAAAAAKQEEAAAKTGGNDEEENNGGNDEALKEEIKTNKDAAACQNAVTISMVDSKTAFNENSKLNKCLACGAKSISAAKLETYSKTGLEQGEHPLCDNDACSAASTQASGASVVGNGDQRDTAACKYFAKVTWKDGTEGPHCMAVEGPKTHGWGNSGGETTCNLVASLNTANDWATWNQESVGRTGSSLLSTSETAVASIDVCQQLPHKMNSGKSIAQVWTGMIGCTQSLATLAERLQGEINDAKMSKAGDLSSYSAMYDTLMHLQGSDVMGAM